MATKKKAAVTYIGTGRRKQSTARVFMTPGTGTITVNGKTLEEYLKQEMMISNTYPEMHAAITGADIKGYRTMERGFLDATGFYR